MKNEISIVIGSWGSYNACNEKALGSQWLNLVDFETYEDIQEELTKQGFILNGIDEELFIQDIDGIESNGVNWDYVSPKTLFETLKESGVLDDDYLFEKMQAFIEVRGYNDFVERVENKGSNWEDDIYIYQGFDWFDFGKEHFNNCCYQVPEHLEYYIDFEKLGKSVGDYYAEEYSNGIIEIL